MIPTQPGVFLGEHAESVPRGGCALFLDRDGVINVDHGYVCRAEETQWVDGIFDLCRGARDLGYALVVVTNQAGLARGFYTEQEFRAYTSWVHAQFKERGVDLLATIYCPHHPTAGTGALTMACTCRKPAPGMLLEAERRFGFDMAESALVGDKRSDAEAGHAAGVRHLYVVGREEVASGGRFTRVDQLLQVLDELRSLN